MKRKVFSHDLLGELNKPEYVDVIAEFKLAKYPKSALVSVPGHNEDLVFIVKAGRLRVYLAFEDKDFSLTFLGKGDIYATHTRAYVRAAEDSELLVLPTARFHQCMINSPVFSHTIISTLGELLTKTFSIVEGLVFKDVTQRIIDFYLYEAQHNGYALSGGIAVKIDLTMEQLAAVVGASRQTVSTIVNQMQKDGVLEKKGNDYFFPNLALLKEFPHC